jgi:hypothetical protein
VTNGRGDVGEEDAPVLKTLMYLLLHQVFEHEYSGPREKDNLRLWQSLLVAAAKVEAEDAARDGLGDWQRVLVPAQQQVSEVDDVQG